MLVDIVHSVHIEGVDKCVLSGANLIDVGSIHHYLGDCIIELLLRSLTVNIRVITTMWATTILPHVMRGSSIKTLILRGLNRVAGISR